MSRKKPVVQIGMCTSNVRRSPRLRKQNEAKLCENLKNPNFESLSGLRRSPRNVKLGDRNSIEKPKNPNLESQVRQSRVGSYVSPRPYGGNGDVRDNECVADASRKEDAGKCLGFEMRRSPRFGKSKMEQLDGLKIGTLGKKLSAVVRTDGGDGNVAKGLRRSPRFLNQQKNCTEADQKLDSLLDKICDNDGDSREQTVKRNRKKSVTPVESEEEWSQSKETRLKNEGKEAEAGNKKRKRGKEGSKVVGGWTKEQEMALERAYLAMKPTPRFWKKVSKMVGKTAQECFDRINYDPHTPVPPRPRSRIKKKTSPITNGFSLSASKLLCSLSPKGTRKRNAHLGQKKIRKLLQKQCNIERDYEGDLFSILEGSIASPIKISQQTPGVSTPEQDAHKNGSSSFSRRKKSISKFSSAAPIISPPVLKQVKNKALHEKYIDKLHSREAKRQAELTRAKKAAAGKENITPYRNQIPNIIRDAKNALQSDARDVVLQFQKLQSKAISPSETDDDMVLSENEDEDNL